MIHFISRHLQTLHYERDHWLTLAEKKRAVKLIAALVACLTVTVLIWLIY